MSSPPWLVAAGLAGAATAWLLTPLTRRLVAAGPNASDRITPVLRVSTIGATAVLFAAFAWRIPSAGMLPAGWCLAAVAVPLAVLDVVLRRLPDLLVGPA